MSTRLLGHWWVFFFSFPFPLLTHWHTYWKGWRCPEQVTSSREHGWIRLKSMVHGYRFYQEGHVTERSCLTVPSSPLPLTTSSSSEQKRLAESKDSEQEKKRFKSKKSGVSKRNADTWGKIKMRKMKYDDKMKKVVSRSAAPSQSLERAAEIRKPGVRFPVKVRTCFGVKMWSRWFIWNTTGWIKRIGIKMRTTATRLARIMCKTSGTMLKRWKRVWIWWTESRKVTRQKGRRNLSKWHRIICPV